MTEHPDVELEAHGPDAVLRFERRLAHPPEKVWRAVTDPAELAGWFPATVETTPATGAAIRFTFPDSAPAGLDGGSGEILELDPLKVFAFRWNSDVLRFELLPDGVDGCLLLFSQTLNGRLGRLSAGHTSNGWNECLAALDAVLDGRPAAPPVHRLDATEHYLRRFGLDRGDVRAEPDGWRLAFTRDLVWHPVEQAWTALAGNRGTEVGSSPPPGATTDAAEAGRVTEVDAPNLLEYEWLHGGTPAGRVRWEFVTDPEFGTRVELTQTGPGALSGLRAAALAAWHVRLELYFAALHGEVGRTWPANRFEELAADYAERLD